LVNERNLPAELETVARDLWDLRVRNFGGLRAVDGKGQGKRRDAKSEPASWSESEMFFSSQGETDGESDAEAAAPVRGSRIKKWAVREGQKWPLPSLLDTLALCYVGCMAMRLPVRVGDLFRWARSGRLLFVRAVSSPCTCRIVPAVRALC
jgi:RNA polymerase I-specific transcription initiation factor RRN7